MPLAPGQLVDGTYRVERLLGRGGTSLVFLCEDVRARRKVALKVLKPNLSRERTFVDHFAREATACALVGPEHSVEVLGGGELASGERYHVMELLDGESLAARLARVGRIEPAAAAAIGLDVLTALATAHAAGVVHRDVKPDNVFLVRTRGRAEVAKLLDFGGSKVCTASPSPDDTQPGMILGTPAYMAPEQARGEPADPRTDVYAVGVTLYRAVSGALPFATDGTAADLMARIAWDRGVPLSTRMPAIDRAFATLVDRATAHEPRARYRDAAQMHAALGAWRGRARPGFPRPACSAP